MQASDLVSRELVNVRWFETALAAIRRRSALRWLLPLGLFGLVVLYELGPATWTLAAWGSRVHIALDIAVYGVLGPVLAAVLLDLLWRWIEERETTATQALALAQERERAQAHRDLSDDSLQALFAASAVLTALEDHAADLPPSAVTQIKTTHTALEGAIQRLYASWKR
jgi:signal transduction histidine kinase